jgi:hypothetical protein
LDHFVLREVTIHDPALTIGHIQQRDDAFVHRGSREKLAHVRTVPMLTWVTMAIDAPAGVGVPLSCRAKPMAEWDRAAVTCSHHHHGEE